MLVVEMSARSPDEQAEEARKPMPTEAAVLEALRPVEDPELRQSIVDLDMVKEVAIEGGRVAVTVALTVAGCPLRPEITRRVTEAVQPLEGVESVDVDLTVMDDEQRQAVATRLRQQHAPAGAGADGRPARVNPFTDARTRVLAVASGKGGVGKSSVTTNLAVALAQRGQRVAAVDADVWGFSMPRMLGIDHAPVVIDDVIIPPEANGVNLISMGFFAREDQPVVWRGPMLHKALEQFLTDVHWDEPDFLVVDMPPGTGDIALSMAQFLPRAEVLIVTTPQPAAQRVAQRAAYMSQKVNLDVIGVIENMSWFRGDDGKAYELFGAGGGQELADQLGVPLLGQVPLVPELRVGADEGRPFVVTHPDDEASQAFVRIAERVEELAPKKIYRPELKIT
jgi:ATP-binding protein involved in chromosome partitioning